MQLPNVRSWTRHNYYLPENSSFEIECPTTVNNTEIVWFKDKFLVGNDKFLIIEQLHRNNTGYYRCAVTNKFGTILSASLKLTVLCKLLFLFFVF